MLLAIDVGNTNTVFALYREREQVGQWRLSTNRERTSEEYAALLIQLMGLKGFGPDGVGAIVIASVVPPAVLPLRRMSRDFFQCEAFVVGEDLDYPIRIDLANPAEVGADRVVNAVAALTRYSPPLVIVDFGTATTFDVVDREGTYRGGAIAPGINLSIDALARAAAKLPRIAIEPPERVIGRSTVEAMQSGIFWGYVGLIEGLVKRIVEEHGSAMTVIATGGLAPLFYKRAGLFDHLDRDLTMAGLLEIYERNREKVRAGKRRGQG
ncbi:MAG: type III pantothenate kinase [Geminicoccaceae bacterium]|nr:type III pantothenate kinase [Geminicoccaceae bacterium]MCX8102419.1 type III pantothenate kinase [Geminicoccaceae bacterium]MDW8370700.1 type III pantothenate kinase [Geminicoccaceae bacterium]